MHSIVLIFIWLAGDMYKLSYYMANASPFALRACASFQIFTDLCILAQFAIYRKNSLQKDVEVAAEEDKQSKYEIVSGLGAPKLEHFVSASTSLSSSE